MATERKVTPEDPSPRADGGAAAGAPPSASLAAALRELHAALEGRVRGRVDAARALADAIGAELAQYVAAVERDAVHALLVHNGVAPPPAVGRDHRTCAAAVLELVGTMPELGGRAGETAGGDAAAAADDDEADDPAAGAPAGAANDAGDAPAGVVLDALPRARAAAGRAPVVLYGGIVDRKREAWAAALFGPGGFEWVERYQERDGGQGNLVRRARDGRVTAVLICNKFLGHQMVAPVVDACRAGRVPFYMVRNGGQPGILAAARALETALAGGAAAAGGAGRAG